MEPKKAIVCILFVCLATTTAKIFKKCEMAVELDRLKFSRSLLPAWLCMIEAESGFDTKKVSAYPPLPGTFPRVHNSYGVFQINDLTYCGKNFVGGKCRTRCEDLLSDDITKAAQCAQIVVNTEGFKAWKLWEMKCKKSPPMKVDECFRKSAAIAG